MEYARAEVRFVHVTWPLSWPRCALVEGPVEDNVQAVFLAPGDLVITHTQLTRARLRRHHPGLAQVGDRAPRFPTECGAIRLTRRVRLVQGSRTVGRVTALWCDRTTSRLKYLLVRPSRGVLPSGLERVLAAEYVASLSPGCIMLTEAAPPLTALPPYRPDAAIEVDLRLALAECLPTPRARRTVRLWVEDGCAYLSGLLDMEEEVACARRAIQRVAGVRAVRDDLVSAETLAQRVEGSLLRALDELGEPYELVASLRVQAEHRIVYLTGVVPSIRVSSALERAARTVLGVRVVVNQLAIGPEIGLSGEMPQYTAYGVALPHAPARPVPVLA